MYIMEHEPISAVYLINLVNLCVCMCILPIVARHRLGKNVPAAKDTYATIEELLDVSFHMRSVLYEWKEGD
jgi:hypothetical protein